MLLSVSCSCDRLYMSAQQIKVGRTGIVGGPTVFLNNRKEMLKRF
jgi:hypothetical protein